MHLLEPLITVILLCLIIQAWPVLAFLHAVYWGVLSFLGGLYSFVIGLIVIIPPLIMLMALLTILRHAVVILLECTLPTLVGKFTHQGEK